MKLARELLRVAYLHMNLRSDLTRTHKRRILAALQKGIRLDLMRSLQMFDCASLRSRIAELRKEGWPIQTESVKFVSPSGFPGRYAVYYLPSEAQKTE